MINHLIWAAGLFGHLVLLAVLFARRRVARFPWFTLLILFYFLRSLGLAIALRLSGHPVHQFTTVILDLTDVLLQCAVLVELTWIALRPLGGVRRYTLPLLLVASGVLMVIRLAPAGHFSLRTLLVLTHFLLSVLMVEWAIMLTFLLRPLRLSWRSHVAAISVGLGIYSASLLAGGGYFTIGREMRDYVFFSFFRISIYLLVLLWWAVTLWFAEPAG
ncbi:MAG TPA: hypothetical protein VN828_15340 [Acidobacteriaceae bacterium]|nr:hypothetical protein [Acidobacteriaceae bacterium]